MLIIVAQRHEAIEVVRQPRSEIYFLRCGTDEDEEEMNMWSDRLRRSR